LQNLSYAATSMSSLHDALWRLLANWSGFRGFAA
jgi:hypothetical protein